MLLDRSYADFSGLTCNKIGVSFTAFRYQPSGCGNWPQACLANQLDDYHKEDLAKVI
jgi:type IV pilus biogenesis protein CpaD/CtpE